MHASLEYAIQYPDRFKEWHATSQTVVMLTVPNVDWLHLTAHKVEYAVPVARFREPDMGNQLNSVRLCVRWQETREASPPEGR